MTESNLSNEDQRWMDEIISLAKQIPAAEVPVTGILVSKGEKIVAGGNQRETRQNPLGHIEIQLIQEACSAYESWRLPETTLYVLIEPCLMCTGAIYAARIPRVVFGAPNPKGGSLVFIQEHRKQLGLNHSIQWVDAQRHDEASAIMKNFFSNKRRNK
jgi:tRNA(adenine34) deaminase